MNRKVLLACVAAFGVLMLALSAYQFNQYWSTRTTIEPSLAYLDELSASSEYLDALGVGAEDVASTRAAFTSALDSLLQTALFDFALGLLLVGVAVTHYPKSQ
ncbi:MAG: hypothetical protein WC607_04400 [Candidatus Micrarchaeia archaeon]